MINKPAGIVVNRAQSVKEETVQDWAEKKFAVRSSLPAQAGQFAEEVTDFYARSGIVHRLDKETSGCLILATNQESFLKLQSAFKERAVKKTYIALAHGDIPESGEIRAPIGRIPGNTQRFGIVPDGKESVTRYKKIAIYEINTKKQVEKLSLVELYPESGRTHQIRVHLKYLGFPIVGDYLYAGRKTQRADRRWCPRVFLHAKAIEFPHPVSGKNVSVEAPLPEELTSILSSFNNT